MKNIFNHNKHTSIQANQRTNFVILKSAVVTSILKNLSEHTSLPAYQRTSIFSQLSTINHKLLTFCFVLLFISVMFIQSGCSLTADRSIERYLGHNSICWEDNDHILIYASIAQYHDFLTVDGSDRMYDWVGGEIWRITASTGAKELLFRSKESTYYDHRWPEDMRITIVNGNIYVCNQLITYKVRDDFSVWDSIGYFTLPIISEDENTVVAYDTKEYSTVKKYNLENNTSEELYVNDVLIEWLDYDYARNYLLINSNKFVDLNTGEEVIVCESGDSIEDYFIVRDNMGSGRIIEKYLTMDVTVRNINDTEINEYRYKLRININDINEKELLFSVNGILSPDGLQYAVPGLFTDTLGDILSTWTLPSTEL